MKRAPAARRLFAAAGLAVLTLWAGTPVTAADQDSGTIARVESGLRPAVAVAGEPLTLGDIRDRMQRYAVPGVSVAVIEGGKLLWARGYGVIEAGKPAPVDADTLFQAGSISKPIAAATALILADHGLIDIDRPVNAYLSGWRLPDTPAGRADEVTMRRLLSHSAGLGVSGFYGYAPGLPLPTLPEILDGAVPANSDAVRIIKRPGAAWDYSGGGYVLTQLLVEERSGQSFDRIADALVLRPTGMKASSFAQPLPLSQQPHAARGHDRNGAAVPGGWNLYPERAAAGLWTTPSDLARFGIAVMRAARGDARAGLPVRVARWMIEPQPELTTGGPGSAERMGLGLFLSGSGKKASFGHGGSNLVYLSILTIYPETGQGAVIMANGAGAEPLMKEILRAIAAEYHWPDRQQRQVAAVRMEETALRPFVGDYRLNGMTIRFEMTEGALRTRDPGGRLLTLVALGADRFIDPGEGIEFEFARSADGIPSKLTARIGNQRLTGERIAPAP